MVSGLVFEAEGVILLAVDFSTVLKHTLNLEVPRWDILETDNPKPKQNGMLPSIIYMSEYLSMVNNPKLKKVLTRYRVSEHSLAIE